MRIFSNTHLHWSEVQLLKCVARRYPGYAMGMYLYRIQDLRQTLPRATAQLETHAPLEVLQQYRPYYCYHSLGFRRSKHFTTTTRYWVAMDNKENEIYLPSSVTYQDIIAVQDLNHPKPQEIFLPGLLFHP